MTSALWRANYAAICVHNTLLFEMPCRSLDLVNDEVAFREIIISHIFTA